jgi:hypothetical protein
MMIVKQFNAGGRASSARLLWALSLLPLTLTIHCGLAHAQTSPASSSASPQPANIVFVDAAAVTLSPDGAGAFKLDIAIKNSGGSVGTPSFNLRGLKNEKCSKDSLIPDPAVGETPPNTTVIAHFSITDVELPASCYLELVTKGSDVKTITNTSLKEIKLSQRYASADTLGAFVACLVVSALVMARAKNEVGTLADDFEVGGPAWEFAKSWSTTLTLAGAAVTAALSLSALPELTKNASKNGYAIMALLIALLVVVAPLCFVIFRRGDIMPDDENKKETVAYTGGVFAFFVSCNLTLFAGLGQLLILFLLGDELFRDYGVWSWWLVFHEPWWIGLGSILIVATAAVLCWHTVRSIKLTIDLERASPTIKKLAMVKTKAGSKADKALVRVDMLSKFVDPRHEHFIAATNDVEQAAQDLESANLIDNAFRTSPSHTLTQDQKDTLTELARRLEVNLQSADNSNQRRSWPVL